ncbi:hypothetical protein BGZ61DRAFT_500066 [Ilyonectria robusta]|uniref:uncharacterized protein n=1 Tax=Ilyonectria robusta TaxID=1079257 RepID=UPI001E8CDE37|nr:uncharacterized protein BGZ61DRAFT_500066 [Ilyonectria robusta]KAH8657227.1 hypothetical protein BGZ61DRAFT_500066 [Ilyonectria robusta]
MIKCFGYSSAPSALEIPRTYDIAYAKSRSFQEKPGNNRWKPDDVRRAFHLQYTVPAQDLSLFWHLVVEKADSLQIPTQRGEIVTLEETLNLFQQTVLQAFDPIHLDVRSCWLDIRARDHVTSLPPHDSLGSELYTLLWKSQCHHHLHEQLCKITPKARLSATYFRSFLLQHIGTYQCKAKRTRASNPGHPDERKPGIILAKAYNCNKELFSVMFSDYDLFGSGFLPLLALNEEMINDFSSANQGRIRHPPPGFNVAPW